MLTGALLILAPLFLGFAIALEKRRLMTAIHHTVEVLVYGILALLGLALGQMDGLGAQLSGMALQVSALVLVLLVANMIGLRILHAFLPMSANRDDVPVSNGFGRLFLAGLKPLLAVIAGGVAGYWLIPVWHQAEDLATGLLMLLLFLIGLQLRNAGLSLRKLLLNTQGLAISLTLALSSLMGGVVLAPLLDIGWSQALALASGFGWYSLSGIVIGEALGPAWGGVAFLNDVCREIIALAIIPTLIATKPGMAIGYGGATAMDFTLPVIRKSGGLACVPVAIASGFILSFLSPILMAVFLSMSAQ